MDPITHGLIGASASQSFAGSDKLRAAGFTGVIAAMFADLDVLISSPGDPLLNLEMHRQFTHSLVFIPVGALIAAFLVWWFVKNRLSFRETFIFSLAAYATAGLSDTFTSYGVKLLWPLTDDRYSWNLISVFDPLFTLGLILFTGLVYYSRKRSYSWMSWSWMVLYLIFGYAQHNRSESIAQKIVAQQNHIAERIVVKPTIGNQILWSIRYQTYDDSLFAYGVRLSPFSDPIIYRGSSAPLLNWQVQFKAYRGTTMYRDIRRFSTLSQGYLIQHPKLEGIIGDGRYALLPTSMEPLWGIEIDTTRPGNHVLLNTYRNAGPEIRASFFNMLLGKNLR